MAERALECWHGVDKSPWVCMSHRYFHLQPIYLIIQQQLLSSKRSWHKIVNTRVTVKDIATPITKKSVPLCLSLLSLHKIKKSKKELNFARRNHLHITVH